MTEQKPSPDHAPAAETHEVIEIDVVLVDGEVVETTVVTTEVTAEGSSSAAATGLGPSTADLKTRHRTS